MMASALCKQLTTKAIPLIADFLVDGYDTRYTLLEESLYVTCIVNGVSHQNLNKWN